MAKRGPSTKAGVRKAKPNAPTPRGSEPPRRVPVQERSRLRMTRIVEAADRVFADVGYEAATMEQIAERAETSIGSVYQFFPNKGALFEALCDRYFERAQRLLEDLLARSQGGGEARPWTELVDQVIDVFHAFNVEQPGFRAIWLQQSISAKIIEAGDAMNLQMAARAEEVFAAVDPTIPRARRSAAASIVVEAISAILLVAVRREAAESARLIAELKRMVRAYLSTVLPTPATG
ncbi:MAG: TetR family transcriptional regulator [Polyangiaceae bacterium]|nr:TetR family transcriptional regulator [Polyangiaceae bacterium]MBK8941884.1 TetR family transcriptional regulator [Polyangiaceae bacterium]